MARSLFGEGRRLVLRGVHLLGSRTVVVLGLVLAFLTGGRATANLWLAFSGTSAEGVVVRQIEERPVNWRSRLPGGGGGRTPGVSESAAARVYRAVVDFTAGDRSYEVVANARATVHLYPLGSKVDVVYPPGRPDRARLKPELPDFWAEAGLLLVATVVGTGSAYTWLKLARLRAARRRVVKPGE